MTGHGAMEAASTLLMAVESQTQGSILSGTIAWQARWLPSTSRSALAEAGWSASQRTRQASGASCVRSLTSRTPGPSCEAAELAIFAPLSSGPARQSSVSIESGSSFTS